MRLRVLCWALALVVLWAWTAAASTSRSGWSIEHTPNPIGAKASGLSRVSCSSPSACTAVGAFGHGPLAERWNGTSWHIQRTPKLSDKDALWDTSCPSVRVCLAVGETFSQSGPVPLAERWNGHIWSIQRMPGTENDAVQGVSCSSARACIAVGYRYPGPRPLAERWNGSRWSMQTTPRTRGNLLGVSCTSARACIAVGYGARPVVERWNGRAWSVQPTPQITHDYLTLDSVSCTSASSCTAVGTDQLPPPCESTGCGEYIVTRTLAEHWNGHRWSIQRTRSPSSSSDFSAVSCTSARACTAVGDAPAALAERWNGRRWSIQHTVGRVRGRSALLSGVACVPGRTCLAVGQSGAPGSGAGFRTLAERWNR